MQYVYLPPRKNYWNILSLYRGLVNPFQAFAFLTMMCLPLTAQAGAGISSGHGGTLTKLVAPGLPSAPTNISAVAGTEKDAKVSFVAPLNGAPILFYTATSSPDGVQVTGTKSPISFPSNSLTYGTPYTFTVTATNATGTSAPSVASNSVISMHEPGAPTNITATVKSANTVKVGFYAPNPHGSPITSYTVTSSPGGITATGSSGPILVSGLTYGTTYTFTVTATNSVGTGPTSVVSNSVLVAWTPTTPTTVSAVAGDSQATITFSGSLDDGSPITSYTVTSAPGGITATGATSPITVTGLTNGTTYNFNVKSTNAIGTSRTSLATNKVVPQASSVPPNPTSTVAPTAPTGVTATAGNAQATVNFNVPTSNGGATITSYTVISSPEGKKASGSTSPLTVTGLTNGTAYTFTVTATNSAGTGPASSPSNSVTPTASVTPPTPPTTVLAIIDPKSQNASGTSSAIVTFSGAKSNGIPINGYTVTAYSNGTVYGSSWVGQSPATMSWLNNGQSFTFTVTATTNSGVSSEPSAPSNSVTPAGLPGSPTNVNALAGNGQATISFIPETNDNGSPVTGYTVTSIPGGVTAVGSASPIVISGLTNGTSYTFTVTAANSVGLGNASSASNSVTPSSSLPNLPLPPTTVFAVASDSKAVVTFSGAVDNGGGPITSYTVTSSPEGIKATVPANGSQSYTTTVSGLANSWQYTFTVTATNALGTSEASSPSNTVTPAGLPFAPSQVFADGAVNGQAKVSFDNSWQWTNRGDHPNNGSPISSYTVTSSPGGITATGTSTPITITGLTNGTAYTFTVSATNAIGTGTSSTPSNSVIPEALTSPDVFSAISQWPSTVKTVSPHADGARIEFGPLPGAQDYRAYAVDSNGNAIQPTIYYCAGKKTMDNFANQSEPYQSELPVVTGDAHGYTRNAAYDLTMGYVNVYPGPGLVPVYAVGSNAKFIGNPSSEKGGDVDWYIAGRQTLYIADPAVYQNYLKQGWRDGGIVFYVPDPTIKQTEPLNQIYYAFEGDWQGSNRAMLYFVKNTIPTPGNNGKTEFQQRSVGDAQTLTPSIQIFTNPAPGRVSLNRVYGGYENDTLWTGGNDSTFEEIFNGGGKGLMRSINVSGITQPTNFAVEALDSGCPYQGVLAAIPAPLTNDNGIIHQPWYTFSQMSNQNPNGVYINGQFDPNNSPKAIARSIVTITPQARQPIVEPPSNPPTLEGNGNWDYFLNFGTLSPTPTFTQLSNCGAPAGASCWGAEQFTSSLGNAYFMGTIGGLGSVGVVNGQLNLRVADVGSDVNGKVQLPLNASSTPAQINNTGFLHLTFDLQHVATNRLYPQVYISDQGGAPFYNMANGYSLVLQPRHNIAWNGLNGPLGPVDTEIQVCDHHTWDTNNQCPGYIFEYTNNGSSSDPYFNSLRPVPVMEKFSGVKRMVKYDYYVNASQIFLFMDDAPIGCVNLPSNSPKGPVNITLGTTSYHSGVDVQIGDGYKVWDGLSNQSNEIEQSNDFNNVGWKNNVSAPNWDYANNPCQESTSTQI